jgi:hypothetical protein
VVEILMRALRHLPFCLASSLILVACGHHSTSPNKTNPGGPGDGAEQTDNGGGGGGDDTQNPSDSGPALGGLTVVSVAPTNNITGVSVNVRIVIKFSEAIVASTAANRIGLAKLSGEAVAATQNLSGAHVTLVPQVALDPQSDYLVWVAPAIYGVSGSSLADRVESRFTTGLIGDNGSRGTGVMLSPFAGKSSGGGYELFSFGGGVAGDSKGTATDGSTYQVNTAVPLTGDTTKK